MILVPDLPGKMMQRNTGWADGIGHVTRKDNKTIIDFRSKGDINRGTRVPYLREKQITIMESDDNGNITNVYLNSLFPDCEDIKIDIKK